MSRFEIRPISLRAACSFVERFHRHHKKVQGYKFAISLYEKDVCVGVAICGRPVSRRLDNGLVLEVSRVCVMDGIKNGCSKLYGACASGVNMGGEKWNSTDKINRSNEVVTLFGTSKKYPSVLKQRYRKILNHRLK